MVELEEILKKESESKKMRTQDRPVKEAVKQVFEGKGRGKLESLPPKLRKKAEKALKKIETDKKTKEPEKKEEERLEQREKVQEEPLEEEQIKREKEKSKEPAEEETPPQKERAKQVMKKEKSEDSGREIKTVGLSSGGGDEDTLFSHRLVKVFLIFITIVIIFGAILALIASIF